VGATDATSTSTVTAGKGRTVAPSANPHPMITWVK
jgi:hypothetical protein